MFRLIAMMLLLGNAAVGMNPQDNKNGWDQFFKDLKEHIRDTKQRIDHQIQRDTTQGNISESGINPRLPFVITRHAPKKEASITKEDSPKKSALEKEPTRAEKQNSINLPLRILTELLDNKQSDEIKKSLPSQYDYLKTLLGDDKRRQKTLDCLRQDYCPKGKLYHFSVFGEKSPFYRTLKEEQADNQQSIVKSLLNILDGNIPFIVRIYNEYCAEYGQGKKGGIRKKEWINQEEPYNALTTELIGILKGFISPSEKRTRANDVNVEEDEGEPDLFKRLIGDAGIKSISQSETAFSRRKIMVTDGPRSNMIQRGVLSLLNLIRYHCEHVLRDKSLLAKIQPLAGYNFKQFEKMFDDINDENDRRRLAQETWNVLGNLSETIELFNINIKNSKNKKGGRPKEPIARRDWTQDTEFMRSIEDILIKNGAKKEGNTIPSDPLPVIDGGQKSSNDHNDDNKSEESENLFS